MLCIILKPEKKSNLWRCCAHITGSLKQDHHRANIWCKYIGFIDYKLAN